MGGKHIKFKMLYNYFFKCWKKYFLAWKKYFLRLTQNWFSAWNNNVFWHGRKMFLRFDKKIFFWHRTKMFFVSNRKNIFVKPKKHFCSILKNILVPSQSYTA